MLYQDIALGAAQGASQLINGSARRFIYSAGSAGGLDASIVVHTNSGQIKLYPGQWFEPERPETMWMVRNATGAGAINGTVILTSGEFGDQTITGAVQVVDGGKARSMAGVAFSGAGYIAGSAGNYAHLQLWNPAGSGVNCFLESVMVSSSVASGVGVRHSAAQVTAQYAAASKKVGGAAANCLVCAQGLAASQSGLLLVNFSLQASSNQIVNFREPVQIPPGAGVVLVSSVQSTGDISGSFEFFEEKI